jgi:cytochrome c biogenesis protein CcmG, thiol:disulfide interchange protein DsbE
MTQFSGRSRLGTPTHSLPQALLCLLLACLGLNAAAAEPTLDLARFRGKVVVVDFWASWCAPCRQSFPWLNDMQAKHGPRGLVVIGVNVDRERPEAEKFLRDTPAVFQILYDPDGLLAARYEVPGMPSSYVFGPDGELVGRHIGFRKATQAEREAELVRLLAANAAAAAAR